MGTGTAATLNDFIPPKLGTHGSPRRRTGAINELPVKTLGLGDVKRYMGTMHGIENGSTDSTVDHLQQQQHPASIATLVSTNHHRVGNNSGIITMGHTTTTVIPSSPSSIGGGVGLGGGNISGNGSGNSNNIGGTQTTGGITTSSVSSAPNTLVCGGTSNGPPRECAGCSKRITERFLLKALDLFWHEDCLKCGCCDCRLGEVGSTLYTKANLILCKRDYLRLFGTTGYCAACNKVIPAFEMVMRAKNNVYHLECFACQQCNHRFCVGDRFYLCDNKILCEYDYEERLVFANIAYNPSSLAHIRRQVSSIQPAGDSMNCGGRLASMAIRPAVCLNEKLPLIQQQQQQPNHLGAIGVGAGGGGGGLNGVGGQQHRDDGSSGYGSPDSETFETPPAQ